MVRSCFSTFAHPYRYPPHGEDLKHKKGWSVYEQLATTNRLFSLDLVQLEVDFFKLFFTRDDLVLSREKKGGGGGAR